MPYTVTFSLNFTLNWFYIKKKLSSSCEEFKYRGWYDVAFRLVQETHQILFEFQQTRWASRSKSRSRSQDVSSLALYRRRIPNRKFTSLYAVKIVKYGTLSAMLNEFAGIRKASDESLGRDETPRHTSHET